jgi:putative protease
MKLLTNPCSYSNAIDLIKKGVDAISVGESSFSAKNSNDLSFVEIKKILKEKKKTKVFILVNKFFFDTDLVRLEKYLLKICKENIDGIIYSDYAVNQILFENKILINQIYNPETLVVSYGQFDFYKKNSINEVSLAREISSSNIKKILDNKNKMKVQIQVCGYSYMM